MDTFFNVNQAAFILKVHPLTIRRYIREQKLTAVKVGGAVRIRETDLNTITKDFIPKNAKERKRKERKNIPLIPFTHDDPFFRFEGRGASFHLDNQEE